jgi:hypothetical protein
MGNKTAAEKTRPAQASDRPFSLIQSQPQTPSNAVFNALRQRTVG